MHEAGGPEAGRREHVGVASEPAAPSARVGCTDALKPTRPVDPAKESSVTPGGVAEADEGTCTAQRGENRPRSRVCLVERAHRASRASRARAAAPQNYPDAKIGTRRPQGFLSFAVANARDFIVSLTPGNPGAPMSTNRRVRAVFCCLWRHVASTSLKRNVAQSCGERACGPAIGSPPVRRFAQECCLQASPSSARPDSGTSGYRVVEPHSGRTKSERALTSSAPLRNEANVQE